MSLGEERYIGDGIYVRRSQHGVLTLVTRLGDKCLNVIHMDSPVADALVDFVKQSRPSTEQEVTP